MIANQCISTINRVQRCLQRELVEGQIQPAPKLEADLRHLAHMLKAQTLVQRNAAFVGGINRADDGVHIATALTWLIRA